MTPVGMTKQRMMRMRTVNVAATPDQADYLRALLTSELNRWVREREASRGNSEYAVAASYVKRISELLDQLPPKR